MTEGQALAAVIGFIVTVLLPAIGWLIRTRMAKIEQDLNNLGDKVNRHHDEVLRDYVHEDRLKERMESALQPIADALGRIERVIETDLRTIYEKLSMKMDR